MLHKAGTHPDINLVANLRPFPRLVDPERSSLLAGILVCDIGLGIEVEDLLASDRIEGLDLEYLSLGFPPDVNDADVPGDIVRKEIRTEPAVHLGESIVNEVHVVSLHPYSVLSDDIGHERIGVVIRSFGSGRRLTAELRNVIREPLDVVGAQLIVVSVHDMPPGPVVLIDNDIRVLDTVGVTAAEDTEFDGIETLEERLAAFDTALVYLTSETGVHEAVVEYLLEVQFLRVMMDEFIRPNLSQVLPVVVVVFLPFLNLLLSLLVVNTLVLHDSLHHLEELILLVLLYLGNRIGIGHDDLPVKDTGGFLTTQGVYLRVDDGIMLNLVGDERRGNVAGIQDSRDILHVNDSVQQIIVDFQADGTLPHGRVIEICSSRSPIDTTTPPFVSFRLEGQLLIRK